MSKPIQLGASDFQRDVAKIARIETRNRFFERNPVLNTDEAITALFSRPSLKKLMEVGSGHVRKVFSEAGAFDSDLFVVSGLFLYRVSRLGVVTTIGQLGSQIRGDVSFAATAPIGDGADAVPEFLFIADGGVLWYYSENSGATGNLQLTGSLTATDVVEINGTYYEFTAGSVDAGTPDGTLANPWLVAMGASDTEAITNLYNAINDGGTAGTDYSTALTVHPEVEAYSYTATDIFVAARAFGTVGNAYTTTETSAGLTWGSGTLTGGGTEGLRQVLMPGDFGAISVGHINSYVIVIPAQGGEINGRFYWIEPGELEVDPLNFATAERSPDEVNQVIVFSDRFWLLGQSTTEAWITTGDPAAPMQRFSGILYDRGTWEGTGIKVKDSLVLIDEDGAVFQIGNAGLKRLSTQFIEERIRRAIVNATLN